MSSLVDIRGKNQILQEMINLVVTRTSLSDLLPASQLTQVLAAAAQSDETLYLQLAKLLKMFSIRRADRQGLAFRAFDYNTEVLGAQFSQGLGYFTRTVSPVTPLTLVAGTVVSSSSGVQFRTLVDVTIPGAATQSPATGIIAVLAGEQSNLATGAVQNVTAPVGVVGADGLAFVSTTPTSGGYTEEATEALRQRLIDIEQSLNRTSAIAVPARARLITLSTNERVQTAKLVEDVAQAGRATLYIDNGTGTTEVVEQHGTNSGTGPIGGEVLIASAAGGEARFQVLMPPLAVTLVGTPLITLYLNTVTILTVGVHFDVIPGTGAVQLRASVFPTGLAATDLLEAVYTSWAGLIRAVQWDLSGRNDDPQTYRGGFAGGGHYLVRSPEIYRPAISCRVTVGANYVAATVRTAVKDALLIYINSLAIGQDVVLAELYDVAMAVDGVSDFIVTSPAPADPAPNIVVGDDQLVRLQAPDLTVT